MVDSFDVIHSFSFRVLSVLNDVEVDSIRPIARTSFQNQNLYFFIFRYFLQSLIESQTLSCAHSTIVEVKPKYSDLSLLFKGYFLESMAVWYLNWIAFDLRYSSQQLSTEMDGRWNLERKRCFLAFQVSHQSNPHCSVNCLHTNCFHFGHKNFSVFDVRRNSDLSLFAIAVSKTGYFSVTDCESDLQSGLSFSCQRLSDDILGSF